MSKVNCVVDTVEMDGDYGEVEGVVVTCSRCHHDTESYGTSGASIRRCLALMREECPNGEHNYYVAEGSEADDE